MQAQDYFKVNLPAHTLLYLDQSCFSAICPTKSHNSIFQKYGERKLGLCKQLLIRTTKERKRRRASHGSPLLVHDCRSFSFLNHFCSPNPTVTPLTFYHLFCCRFIICSLETVMVNASLFLYSQATEPLIFPFQFSLNLS